MNAASKKTLSTAALGVLVCACMVLQQWLVPLHLSMHEHTVVFGHSEHVAEVRDAHHSHSAHGTDHHHEVAGEESTGPVDKHPPHPSDDHEDQQLEPFVPSGPTVLVLAAFAEGPGELNFCSPVRGHVNFEQRAPRAPPPRRACASRAPPASA